MTLCTVLVLDGDENQAVACTRDLANAGYRVAVGDIMRLPKAALSRSASARLQYASPRLDATAFAGQLERAVGSIVERGAVLLPMTEATTLAVSTHRDRLAAAGYRMVLPPHDTLLLAFDKRRTSAIADACGIRTPQQVSVDSDEGVARACALEHPVVIKASESNMVTARGVVASPRPQYSTDPARTHAIVTSLRAAGVQTLVQEFIGGAGVGFFGLYRHGVMERAFAHRRLRDVHPTGSGSSYRESIALTPELQRAGSALLDAMHWHGAAMVEFKQRPDGSLVFIEVNGRLWNSLALAVGAGATFPRWLARLACDEPLDPSPPYRVGLRARWIVGDLRHLGAVVRGKPAGFPGEFPTIGATLAGMAGGLGSDLFDNLQWNDPLPELGDWWSVCRKVIRQVTKRS